MDSARSGPDSSARSTAPAVQAGAAPGTVAAAALPGALTKPIDQYSADELYDLVHRLRWGGGDQRERRCKGDPACDDSTSTKRTKVLVDAVAGQDSISPTALPTNGVIAVRAANRGALPEARYGFKPDKRLEYYLIVLPGTGANGRWRFEELDTTPGARRHSSIGTGTFKPCNHKFRRNPANRANFYTCENSPSADSVQTSNLMMFSFPKDRDPVWTSCSSGCCIADGG